MWKFFWNWMPLFLLIIFRQIDSREIYEELQEELVDRFGEYPDEVAYLLEIGLLKHFADNALVEKIEKSRFEATVTLEKVANTTYDPQDYFKALAKTSMKASVGEKYGKMTFRFKIENRNSVVLLSEIMNFIEELSKIRDSYENK